MLCLLLLQGRGGGATRITSTPKSTTARGGSTRGGAARGGGATKPTARVRNVDAPMDIVVTPLMISANRYQVKKDAPPDEQLKRSVTAILNKLTPEKFDILVEALIGLKIDTVDQLRDVVVAIFDKAVAEPAFSPTYAEFCVRLVPKMPTFDVVVPAEPDAAPDSDGKIATKNETKTFKRFILNQCQTEFEGDTADMSEEEKAKLTDEQKESFATKQKKRQLGMTRPDPTTTPHHTTPHHTTPHHTTPHHTTPHHTTPRLSSPHIFLTFLIRLIRCRCVCVFRHDSFYRRVVWS